MKKLMKNLMNVSAAMAFAVVGLAVAQSNTTPRSMPTTPATTTPTTPASTPKAQAAAARFNFEAIYSELGDFKDDFKQIGTTQEGKLEYNDHKLIPFTAPADGTYALLAICDDKCADIDLMLFNKGGNTISIDDYEDAYPLVIAENLKKGDVVYGMLSMFDCTTTDQVCAYKVGFFQEIKK